jgi:hypothetical protein
MLSSKLVRLIEEHWDPLTTRIVKEFRTNARLRRLGDLPESELRERARDILEHLGHWLTLSGEHELAPHFERIGAMRHEEGIPLREVVLAYSVIKNEMIEYARAQGIGPSTIEIYAEEELQHCISRFFDSAVYHVVCGYENTISYGAAHAHAAAKR